MSVLYLLIPVAVLAVAFAIWLFFWAVNNGQYDDLDSPAHSILFDEEDPRHQAGITEAGEPQQRSDSQPETERNGDGPARG